MRVLLTALGLVIGWPAAADWHEQFAGVHDEPMVAVHHVRLSGHGSNNEFERKYLIEMRQSCERGNRDIGKPVAPLPASGYPQIIKPVELDVYYASNRILTVSRAELYSIEIDDCSLNRSEGEGIELFSRIGTCKINLRERTAGGHCDMAAHARAAPLRAGDVPKTYEQALQKGLAGLPADVRRKVEASGRAAAAQVQRQPGAGPTSEIRTVAGLECRVHHGAIWNGQTCIADPTPETVPGLDPYPIMAATPNLFLGGIALESTSWMGELKADRVELSLKVPQRMFEIPAGFKVTSYPMRPSR